MFSGNILTTLCLFFIYKETYSIVCYHCDGVETSEKDCTTLTNCTGKACILYERPDGIPTSSFCVHDLPKAVEEKIGSSRQCWQEPDGKGKHCICGQKFCNKPRAIKELFDDPKALPIKNATLVKKNPLIDYDELSEEEDNGMNAKPPPVNIMFPSAAEIDPRVAGEDSKASDFAEEDLIPLGHENYEYEEEKITKPPRTTEEPAKKNYHHHRRANSEDEQENQNGGRNSIPPVILVFFSSAASIARLFS